jgi:hypothetical protein
MPDVGYHVVYFTQKETSNDLFSKVWNRGLHNNNVCAGLHFDLQFGDYIGAANVGATVSIFSNV